MKTLISLIAKNCEWLKTVNENYLDLCESRIEKLESLLPSGSGINCGCKIDREKSGLKKVVINTSFHHINNGYYSGWTEHKIVITPNLSDYPDMRITGENKNQIKEYLEDVFSDCLFAEVEESEIFNKQIP